MGLVTWPIAGLLAFSHQGEGLLGGVVDDSGLAEQQQARATTGNNRSFPAFADIRTFRTERMEVDIQLQPNLTT
jgi:hypothetical protein